MLYVVAMPVPVYVFALCTIAIILLVALWSARVTVPFVVTVPIWITLAGIILAFVALYFTWDYGISSRACDTGIYGLLTAQLVIAAQIVGLIGMLAVKWQGTVAWLRSQKRLVGMIVGGQVIAALVLARSAAVCTV